jgi:hypothetical protein
MSGPIRSGGRTAWGSKESLLGEPIRVRATLCAIPARGESRSSCVTANKEIAWLGRALMDRARSSRVGQRAIIAASDNPHTRHAAAPLSSLPGRSKPRRPRPRAPMTQARRIIDPRTTAAGWFNRSAVSSSTLSATTPIDLPQHDVDGTHDSIAVLRIAHVRRRSRYDWVLTPGFSILR